ncbi:MAG: hypothetical protein J0653_03020, partial [Deltaproteobacteria bacterium]|nr:hypothetical protein [Deltaproteobacteria bacterium]
MEWLQKRAGKPLPPNAWNGETFDLEEVGSQRVGAVSILDPQYWAARLDDSDSTIPLRSWVNEVGLAKRDSHGVILGTRLLCVTRGRDEPYQPTIQRFVRTAVEHIPGAYVEGRKITALPWVIEDEDGVEELTELLANKLRR